MSSAVQAFLHQQLGDHRCCFLTSGANSRGYRVRSKGHSYFLKCYPADCSARDRMQREIVFTEFLKDLNITNIPAIVAYSYDAGVILFEFIDGKKVLTVDQSALSQALLFLKRINQPKPHLKALPEASEAAWTVGDFEQIVRHRQAKLNKQLVEQNKPDLLFSFINLELNPALNALLKSSQIAPLPEYQLVSPSDFGFHNALEKDGELTFFDFEYAGMDSAWKLLADFLAQPAYPVPERYFGQVFSELNFIPVAAHKGSWLYCFHLTLFKWVQIMLKPLFDAEKLQPDSLEYNSQLTKARHYLEQIPRRLAQAQTTLGQ